MPNSKRKDIMRSSKKDRFAVILPVFVAIICIFIISLSYALNTIRYTNDRTAEPVTDNFEEAYVACDIVAGENGLYTVTNTGNVSAYIRVTAIPMWVNASGEAHFTEPVVTFTADENWIAADDGYYYYKTSVAVGDSVTITLIHDDGTDPCPVGYVLDMNFVAEVIQSVPNMAVQDAWDITLTPDAEEPDDDNLDVGTDDPDGWGDVNDFEDADIILPDSAIADVGDVPHSKEY